MHRFGGIIDSSLGETCETNADCKALDDCVPIGNGLCQMVEGAVKQVCGGKKEGITYHCVCLPESTEESAPIGGPYKKPESCYEHTLPYLDPQTPFLSGLVCQDDCAAKIGADWKCVSTQDDCHCQYIPSLYK